MLKERLMTGAFLLALVLVFGFVGERDYQDAVEREVQEARR